MKISRLSFPLRASGRGVSAVRLLSSALAVSLLVAACGDNANDSDNDDDSGDDSTDTGGSQNGSGGDGQGTGGDEPGTGGNGTTSGGTNGTGGEGGEGGQGGGSSATHDCSTTIPATTNTWVELCEIDGAVQHVRIEGLLAPKTHASTQVVFGFEEAPTSNTPIPVEGQFDALFYGGGPQGPDPLILGYFGAEEGTLEENAAFLNAASTVCFDLHAATDTLPPRFIVWHDGENGADCEDFSTLTLESAVGRELWWGGETSGGITPDLPTFFRQAGQQEAVVTLFDAPAITDTSHFPPFECSTTVAAEQTGFVEVCEIASPVRHVKIEGFDGSVSHKVAQVLFGFEETPTAAPSTFEDDQFHFRLYSGMGTELAAQALAQVGTKSTTWDEGTGFIRTPSTICFDLHDGSATTAPYFTLWVDGEKGADCDDRDTLTFATSFASKLQFAKAALDKSAPVFFRKTATVATTVTVSSWTATQAVDAATASTCTTTWTTNTEWQKLCQPVAGPGRHFRIVDAASVTNSNYFYLVLGEPTGAPSGTPAVVADSGTFIMTGGRNHAAASATSFRFNTNTPSTAQYDFGLYTPNASTVCVDQGKTAEGYLRIRLWASGQNGANCSDLSTLTAVNTVYSSLTTDTTMWNAAFSTTLNNYIKTSNTGASLGSVLVSSELAVP